MENTLDSSVMTVKDWAITIFVTGLPLIGFIMLFVWGFGSGTNVNKANFAKGTLLIYLIFTVLSVIFFILFGAAIFSAIVEGAGDYY